MGDTFPNQNKNSKYRNPTFYYIGTLGYKSCMTFRSINYGNYGMFLVMGNAGFISSTVVHWVGFRVLGLGFRGLCGATPVLTLLRTQFAGWVLIGI